MGKGALHLLLVCDFKGAVRSEVIRANTDEHIKSYQRYFVDSCERVQLRFLFQCCEMEWTNDLIFEFLNLYQKEPTLWNYTTHEHKNKNDAFDAWNRIKQQLKNGTIPIKEIKKKRDNLMSTYRRQRTKVRESMEAGSETDEVFKPEWPFYNLMSTFLDDIYKPKKHKCPEDLNHIKKETYSNETTQTPHHFERKDIERNKSTCIENSRILSTPTHIHSQTCGYDHKRYLDSSVSTIHDTIKRLKEISDDNKHDPNEFDVFCESLAIQLKKMPVHRAIICQEKLLNVITQERLYQLAQSDPSISSSLSACQQPIATQTSSLPCHHEPARPIHSLSQSITPNSMSTEEDECDEESL